MPLPPELSAPPPRDPARAGEFLKKTRKKSSGLFVSAAVLFPVVVFLMWLKFGAVDGVSIGLSAGISGLVALMGVAMAVNGKRALLLYTQGVAVMGKVKNLAAPGDRQGNAYVMIEVEFIGATGTPKTGKVTTIGNVTDLDIATGSEIAVLYSPDDPKRFAVYSPKMGISAGIVAG